MTGLLLPDTSDAVRRVLREMLASVAGPIVITASAAEAAVLQEAAARVDVDDRITVYVSCAMPSGDVIVQVPAEDQPGGVATGESDTAEP